MNRRGIRGVGRGLGRTQTIQGAAGHVDKLAFILGAWGADENVKQDTIQLACLEVTAAGGASH